MLAALAALVAWQDTQAACPVCDYESAHTGDCPVRAAIAAIAAARALCVAPVDEVPQSVVTVRGEDYPSLAVVWENDEDDAPPADPVVTVVTNRLCLDCGHTHECWCGGQRDPIVEASLCCECDRAGHTRLMRHPLRLAAPADEVK